MPQLLAAYGFYVFQPNYRGSDNLGAAFTQEDAGDQRVPTPLAYAFYHAIRAVTSPGTPCEMRTSFGAGSGGSATSCEARDYSESCISLPSSKPSDV